MNKAEIRKQIAGQKSSIGFPILEAHSAAAIKRFQTLEVFHTARTLGAYVPLPDEIDVTSILVDPNRSFYIPAFDEALGYYRMAKMGDTFQKGRFGILEPVNPVFAEPDEIDLLIVPGIAFDHAGYRLGRGGGFYDRLLSYYQTVRVGLCFDFQFVETVPTEQHDAKMNFIVTDSQVLECAMND